jgi:hypothetical protein
MSMLPAAKRAHLPKVCGFHHRHSTRRGPKTTLPLPQLLSTSTMRPSHRSSRSCKPYRDLGRRKRQSGIPFRLVAAQGRKFDVLLIWKLDRYARSLKHLVNALAEFDALGIAFVSLRDNLDLTTPAGRLMFQIIGAMAEFDRALIQERVRAGLRNARAKGKRLGRPRHAYPQTKVERLRAQGLSWADVAGRVGVPKATLLRKERA